MGIYKKKGLGLLSAYHNNNNITIKFVPCKHARTRKINDDDVFNIYVSIFCRRKTFVNTRALNQRCCSSYQ